MAAIGDELKGEISSETSTGTSGPDGTRVSSDSDWSSFPVPSDYAINKDKTNVEIISEMGSEHDYTLEYDNYVEVVPGTGIKMPQLIRVKTHARSSKGPFGGKGSEKVKVTFYYVKFR
jgi:hypothetical protein